MTRIERLPLPADDADLVQLARLLLDAIESGAAVSFLATLTEPAAVAWWRETLARAHPHAVFLVARDEHGICGAVQMHPAWAPNQPHRAEVAKLLVHRRARRRGLGASLMGEIELAACAEGITLLTLDARRGGAAEALYRKLGWVHAGTIPAFAFDPDGTTPHDAVIFYKRLGSSPRGCGAVMAAQGATPGDSAVSTVTLYRPVGPKEFALLATSGFRRWPTRLPEQPIFYPVTNERYATEIAERWNVAESGAGYVVRFTVERDFMARYEIHQVGAAHHLEWWIPAEELELLNDHIVGQIEVVARFGRAVDGEAPAPTA